MRLVYENAFRYLGIDDRGYYMFQSRKYSDMMLLERCIYVCADGKRYYGEGNRELHTSDIDGRKYSLFRP